MFRKREKLASEEGLSYLELVVRNGAQYSYLWWNEVLKDISSYFIITMGFDVWFIVLTPTLN